MSTPTGQIVLVDFKDFVNSGEINSRLSNFALRGIYSGGYLTKINDTTVSLSTLTCELGDSTYQVKVTTTTTNSVTVGVSTTYVVLRWAYVGSPNTAMTILAVSSPATNDLVVGKCVFSGSTLVSFDNSVRSNPLTFDKFLSVEAMQTPSMYVQIRSGLISFGTNTVRIVDQTSPLFSMTGISAGQSRIDALVTDGTGSISIIQGTSATTGSQVAPNYGIYLALAEITLTYGQTSITTSSIKVVSSAKRYSGNAVLLTTDQTVAGVKSFQGGLVIENRTSDPSSPVTGQIWLRTDL